MAIQLIKHHTDLHDPAVKIHGTRPRMRSTQRRSRKRIV
jgi:hypothetical protein